MEIMHDHYVDSSTVRISQLPVNKWYGIIGDDTLADVILDRVIHNSHRLELGASKIMRKEQVRRWTRKMLRKITDEIEPLKV